MICPFSGGKEDEELIIPVNDSISGTLSVKDLCAMTTVAVHESFDSDKMWLNGVETIIDSNKRLLTCLKESKTIPGDTSLRVILIQNMKYVNRKI